MRLVALFLGVVVTATAALVARPVAVTEPSGLTDDVRADTIAAVAGQFRSPARARAAGPALRPQGDQEAQLSAAVRGGDVAAVRALLDSGVDVNTKFRYDVTALFYACDRGNVAIVQLLLERGADPNAIDTFYGVSPLDMASSPAMGRTPRHAEVVRLLLEHGATGGDSALLAAITAGDGPMIRVLLEHGGLSDAALSEALEVAEQADATDLVEMLTAAGAKPAPIVTLTADQLERYPGFYRREDSLDGLVVTLANGRLVLDASQLGGPAELPLTPRSEVLFASAGGPDLTFELDDGSAVAIVLGTARYVRSGGGE
jgi:hypothetical protein